MTRAAISCWLFPALLCWGCTVRGSIGTLCVEPSCGEAADGGMRSVTVAGGTAAPATSTPSGMPRQVTVNGVPMCVQPVAFQPPLALHFLVDDTWGMLLWWDELRSTIDQFVTDPRSAGISVGLSLIGEQCFEDAHVAPTVPMAALPSNSMPITAALPEEGLRASGKATLGALRGTLRSTRSWAQQHPGTETRVVLIMAKVKDDCDTTDEQVVQAAREGFENNVPIRTHVIAFDSELDPIAIAGGTGGAYRIRTFELTPPEEVLRSLSAIRDAALPSGGSTCSVLVPAGQPVDSARAQLRLLQGGSEQVIAGVQNRAGCAGAPDGFYYDDLTAALVGCDQSCDKLRSAERVDLLSECPVKP